MTEKHQFEPGYVNKHQLTLLLEISKIRSIRIKKALYDHLVHGRAICDVCQNYLLDNSYFYRRLKSIRLLNERILMISAYYQ